MNHSRRRSTCRRKTWYPDQPAAEAVIATLRWKRREVSTLFAYRCRVCTGWHLGNRRRSPFMPVTHQNVDDVFTYHSPDAQQIDALQRVRAKAKDLAREILDVAPACADTQAGLRKIREGVMTVNAAIALRGRV